jgi:chromosome segregation ATPase
MMVAFTMLVFSNRTREKSRMIKAATGCRTPKLILAAFLLTYNLEAAPRNGQYYQDPHATAIREMRDSLEYIRHEVNNHETEIRIFDEKMKNFDLIVDSVRDQVCDTSRQHKELMKGNSAILESKIQALEATSKSLITDLKQFQIHSNETTALLIQYRQKIGDLEKSVDQQNQNIENLQAAMRSLMEVFQGKPQSSSVATSDKIYKVKSGDSLEKIARAHQITIQALKAANSLTSDKIVVGKTLIIPEK